MHFSAIRRFTYAVTCLALGVCATATTTPTAEAAGHYRYVAPDGASAAVLPSFDAAGRVVMRSLGVVSVEEPTGVVPKLSDGGAAPGFPAGTLINRVTLGSPVVQKGPPTMVAQLQSGPGVVYVDEPGTGLRLASYSGKVIDAAAGIEVVNFVGPGPTSAAEPIANDSGAVLMYGRLKGGPLGTTGGLAAWIERPSGSQIVFHANTTMPGVTSKFGDFPIRELAFENTGRVATIQPFSTAVGLWVFDAPGSTTGRLVARTDTSRHGITFSSLTDLHMASGRLVFHGDFRGIFSERNGVAELVAGVGRPAPGFGAGATYWNLKPESTAMNARGDIAFVGEVADPLILGGYATALWIDAVDRPVEFRLNLGQLLGTTPPGSGLATANKVIMNDRGQLAFVGTGAQGGLWWYDPVTGPQRVAAPGQQVLINVAGAPALKTISSFNVGGFVDSALNTAPYLNNAGQVVFAARFTDNTRAVVVWSPVPEPSASLLQFAAALVLIGAGRRRSPA